MYIISQVFGFIALIITLYSYYLKNKKQIFKKMCIANIFEIIHYLLLNGYSGCVTKLIALFRNIFIIRKEDDKKLKSNVFLVIFIVLYIIFAIIFYKDIYSLLPFVAAIIYMIVVWNGNELQIKRIAFLCYFFWLIYNIYVFSIIGIISNIIALISTYIAYDSYRKDKENRL